MNTTKYAILLAIGTMVCSAAETQNIPVDQLGKEYQLVGKLNAPLGDPIAIVGIVDDEGSKVKTKGTKGSVNLRVKRIQGRVADERMRIAIEPYIYKWGEKTTILPELVIGATYEMVGYQSGAYVAEFDEEIDTTFQGELVHIPRQYFREKFVVVKAKRIAYEPWMFITESKLPLSNEKLFFKSVYQKHPNEYFELGCTNHLTSLRSGFLKNRYIEKASFLSVNTAESDEKQYLREINDSVIRKYLPNLHFYYGKLSCSHGLGVDGVALIGFLHGDYGDFVLNQRENDFNASLLSAVKGAVINGHENKQNFTFALLKLLAPVLLFNANITFTDGTYRFSETVFQWKTNKLTTINYYLKGNKRTSIAISVVFKGDRLSFMHLPTKH
jgi:hypothetical protein